MVRVGDVRVIGGIEYVVMDICRGRRGETRTVYTMGRVNDNGMVTARETRSSDTVRSARLVRRGACKRSPIGQWGDNVPVPYIPASANA